MADNARGVHVSPGVYSREIDMTYAVKSLGITTLGVVGETIKGPAFQPMHIENWREFTSMFGGTSTEKYKGTLYPKYELPYIAKSYLTESKQLEVVRVLGLCGYNAGPAWVVTAKFEKTTPEGNTDMVVCVLRSRGKYYPYRKFTLNDGSCECPNDVYDSLVYDVGEVKQGDDACQKPKMYNGGALALAPYNPLYSTGNECEDASFVNEEGDFNVSINNWGKFKVIGVTGIQSACTDPTSEDFKNLPGYFEYPVSLNPNDKDFILNVLGTNPQDGDAPVYVEKLYDVALYQCIANSGTTHVNAINPELTFYQVYYESDYCGLEPITGLMTEPETALSRRNIGQRFLATEDSIKDGIKFTCHPYNYETNTPVTSGETKELVVESVEIGQIYTVVQYTTEDGKREYFYRYYKDGLPTPVSACPITLIDHLQYGKNYWETKDPYNQMVIVKNESDGLYYRLVPIVEEPSLPDDYVIGFVNCNLNNYKSAYRYASTPWIVSNLKGDFDKIELNKLFRFHTISDGDNANKEIKISIENILPDEGLFDVVVRRIDDIDFNIIPLEKFSKCSLVPGTNNYIAFKIGSYDGMYESKSKYITVEVNENGVTESSIPAGFLGYPIHQYDGLQVVDDSYSGITNPIIKYNLNFDDEIKNRKQYFGLSDITGVDIDLFTFNGNLTYIDVPENTSNGFHLDSRLNISGYKNDKQDKKYPTVSVDGVLGYKFDAVSPNNTTTLLTEIPVIGNEAMMQGSIYEYVNLRKFTVYFYGGFDGWDVYRNQRSNTDDFKMSKYRGSYNKASGEGYSFNKIKNPDVLGLNQNGITSDWYAYLSAIRQFANPEATDINILATPGIDYVNNKLLVEEVIDMVENERADSIYVVTTPDKPSGAEDFVDDMFTAEDAVYNLEDSELNSNYTCTYYPWVKYFDVDNSQYIYLPVTKDAVRNFAQTDNTTYPWFAPAGLSRGDVECVRAKYITRLADEDVLYEGRINPVKTFATDGVKIWGQKNLQFADTQLNRIAVRRLLLRMRKLVAIACRSLIFEPNDSVTKNQFLTAVTPILDNIRSNRGISDYKIEVDDTIEARDRRELPAKIFFKPYNALEYVTIDFVLTPEGLFFDQQ
jgi:hypothetical protein